MSHLPHSAVNPSPGERPAAELLRELIDAIDALLDLVSVDEATTPLKDERRDRFDELDSTVSDRAGRLGLQTRLPPSYIPHFRGHIHFLGNTNLPANFDLTGFTPFMTDHWQETLRKLRVAAEQLVAESPPARQTEGSNQKQKRRGGKRRLEVRNRLLFQVYDLIRREHRPGEEYGVTIDRLKSDKQFVEQVAAARQKLNTKLVRRALDYFYQRDRRAAADNRRTELD
jgi:hypothetical protein